MGEGGRKRSGNQTRRDPGGGGPFTIKGGKAHFSDHARKKGPVGRGEKGMNALPIVDLARCLRKKPGSEGWALKKSVSTRGNHETGKGKSLNYRGAAKSGICFFSSGPGGGVTYPAAL